ncbi:Vacuolar sorting protein 9 (VPS9) domain [Carpediemonas membranifera]|uniref:Vacuolar sorting protein 9 (VPS9) domain n=1 Tax=Carpediemonas membranifera TaxID=201153 RepID=A0A8J6DXH9_9EUKA|nr:Vacuolar sorting protein 9 (VPS9) domain [Carpediemonas membranifera]|eukprot:KAG9390189.1 Vacuolar sorting protein 9 (VPS9) domain [Carpediemonas membranifera]
MSNDAVHDDPLSAANDEFTMNPFIHVLRSPEYLPELPKWIESSENAAVLVPLSSSIGNIDYDAVDFVKTHVVFFNPQLSWQFATANGLLGEISNGKARLRTKTPQIVTQRSIMALDWPQDPPSPRSEVAVMRESRLVFEGLGTISVFLLDLPLVFQGCSWEKEARPTMTMRRRQAKKIRVDASVSDLKDLLSAMPAGIGRTPLFKEDVADDSYLLSTEALTDRDAFPLRQRLVQRLADHRAGLVGDRVRAFTFNLTATPSTSRKQRVADVKNFIAAQLASMSGPYFTEDENTVALDRAGLEAQVAVETFSLVYPVRGDEDILEDRKIAHRTLLLDWVRPEHFDIRCWDKFPKALLRTAGTHLRMLHREHTPAAKLSRLMAASKAILEAFEAADEGAVGADAFLPVFLMVFIHVNPPRVMSDISYIQAIHDPDRMRGEAGYVFTHLTTAANFVMAIKASQLTIDPDVFAVNIREAGVRHAADSGTPAVSQWFMDNIGLDDHAVAIDTAPAVLMGSGPTRPPTPTRVPVCDAATQSLDPIRQAVSRVFGTGRPTMKFVGDTVDSLSVRAAGELLQEYQQLAQFYRAVTQGKW